MPAALLPVSDGLLAGSRLPHFTAPHAGAKDWLILGGCGIAAAVATATLDFNLRVPGHAILRTVLPLAMGLALVPRHGSGVVMSGFAGLTLSAMRIAGWSGGGAGALTSLLLTGPLLDLATCWTRHGWQIYLSLASAGLASNIVALLVRWFAKANAGAVGGGTGTGGGMGRGLGGGMGGGLGGGMGRGLGARAAEAWLPEAMISYPVCGVIAGLIGAAIFFRLSSPRRTNDTGSAG